jgi:hypothetical protein
MGKYDRIIKESLSKLVIPLSKRLGINVENMEIVKDKLQYTIEREPDFLAKIKHDDPSDDYVFQMDFQVPNDDAMPERMLLYRNLIRLFLNLKTRQFVIYLGLDPLTMPNKIEEENLFFRYELIDIREFSSASFLESDIPEEVLLSVLGDFEGVSPDVIVEKALFKLKKLSKRHDKFKKYAFQLHVFAVLRNLQRIYQQKIRAMPLVFNLDIEKDPIFIDGRETGVEQGIEQGIEIGVEREKIATIEKFLLGSILSIKRIADFQEVSIDYVLKIQERLRKEGKL